MTSKRRKEYTPISKYPVYSKEFDRLRIQSQILNNEERPSFHTILWDKQNIQAELRRFIGDSKGLYQREGQNHIALIPSIKLRLEEIDEEFSQYQQERINQGYEKPKMPDDLLNEKYKVEAQEDILLEELEYLQLQLKTYVDKVKKTDDDKVLAFGLVCSACFHGIGTEYYRPEVAPAEIDGQMIGILKDGTLYINDDRSPYFGLSLPEYRKLAKIWMKSIIDADNELLIKMQAEAKEKGTEKPYRTGQSLSGRHSKSSLPPFPDWAINHKALEIEKIQEESIRKKRHFSS